GPHPTASAERHSRARELSRACVDPGARRRLPGGAAVSTPLGRRGADYVNVTAFGKLANSCNQYLAKGRQVSVQGRLNHSEWSRTVSGTSGSRSSPQGW